MTKLSHSLRARLLLLVVLAGIPPTLLWVVSSIQHRNLARREAEDHALAVARLAGREHEALLHGAGQLLPALAAFPEVLALDGEACSRRMADLLDRYPSYANIGAIRANGILFCSGLPFTPPVDLEDRLYFQEALAEGSLSVGEFQIGRVTHIASVNLGYPAIDASGRTVAVVFLAIDLKWIEELAASAELPPGATLTIFDHNGTVLARHPDGGTWTGRTEPTADVVRLAQTVASEDSVQAIGFDGTERIYGVLRLGEAMAGQPVFLSVGIPLQDVYADVGRLERYQLLTLVVAIAAALVSGWYLSDVLILRRLEALTWAARGIGRGRLETRVAAPPSDDELGSLTRAFDEMAARLQEHEAALQEALDRLRRTNRALTLLSGCNQVLLRVSDEAELTREICRTIVEQGGFPLVWVGEAADGSDLTLVPRASAGPAIAYLENAAARSEGSPFAGPAAAAIETERPTVIRDVQTDDRFAGWRDYAGRYGFRSGIALPLRRGGEVVGALSIYSHDVNAFDDEEERLLTELADDLSYGWEARRVEHELERMATFQESLLSTMIEGLVVEDSQGVITYANPAAARLLGRSRAEMEGRPWREIVPPDQHPAVAAANQRRAEGRSDRYELELDRPDGSRIRVLVSGSPRVVKDGFEGTLAVFADVTGEREARRKAELQDRLASVGQLAAGIAHDFNNIVGAIILYGEMLASERGISERARERVVTIVGQAHRAAELIQQILDFGRRSIVERRPTDLVDVVHEFQRLVARTLPETIRLHVEHGGGPHVVAADPGRLQQVLINLALNARDAMPSGGEILVKVDDLQVEAGLPPYRDMAPGAWVMLTMSDTGEGIPALNLPHIFEPFFTTKQAGFGTGLGLSQVYGIIKQHDGYIDVRSTVGEGTTFLIYLPRISASAAEGWTGVPALETRAEEYRGDGETILVVEDDEPARAALAETLTALNYRVLLAADGLAAIDVYASHAKEIALVVSDVVMPRMGGIQLFRELRERFAGARALFVTGYPLGSDTRELLEAGRAEWLQKPFDSRTLGVRLRKILST